MPFRNIETHFSQAPQAKIERSRFKYNKPVKMTFNGGELVPFLVEEVLPGDTFDLKLSKVVRLSPSIHPTMDNLYIDTYYFFIPNRLIWDNWKGFMGESKKAWTDNISYVFPKIAFGGTSSEVDNHIKYGSVFPESIINYLICPAFSEGSKKDFNVSLLPLNAYFQVFNDWFRSENLLDEIPIFTGDGYLPTSYELSYISYFNNNFGISSMNLNKRGSCLPVAKFADYFTRTLPQAQKGNDVLIPAEGSINYNPDGFVSTLGSLPAFVDKDGNNISGSISIAGNGSVLDSTNNQYLAYDPKGTLGFDGLEITVNNLRLAILTQRLLEKDAVGGTRYVELIKSHFGVISPDYRLQRSEYLGGKRTLINMSEVIQTSESSSNSPLGDLAGRSLTTGIEDSFIKSFTEHGILLGVLCVRPDRTYSQGIEKKWTRFDKYDFYWPELAHIGEMPVLNKEIYLTDSNETVEMDDVFGYQEAWSDYRTQLGRNVGYMQPGINGSLASWTYADEYSSTPFLSAQWLYQGKNEIDRTLAITSSAASQFIADLLIYGKVVRPMPVYSIPGLGSSL